MAEEWMKSAACAIMCKYNGFSNDWWFPDQGDIPTIHTQIAVNTCKTCPVRGDCLEYAQDNRIEHGIWGGLTQAQRTRRRNTAAA